MSTTTPTLLTPDSVLTNYSDDSLRDLTEKANPEEKKELSELLRIAEQENQHARARQWICSHQKGPMYWLRNLTKTENYHWEEMNLLPEMPFPYSPYRDRKVDLEALRLEFPHDFTDDDPPDYLDIIMGFMLAKLQQLYIPKTREMMTSWLVVGFITWYCQFFKMTQALSQSESDIKAMGLIAYANIL